MRKEGDKIYCPGIVLGEVWIKFGQITEEVFK